MATCATPGNGPRSTWSPRRDRTYQARGTAAAWLWVIARNQAALLLRKRGAATVALLDEGGGPAGDLAEAAAARADLDVAAATVLGPPGCPDREVWRLVFAVNAALGLVASAATLGTRASAGTAQLTFAWLLPMTAACALALAVAVAVRSAMAGGGAGAGAWLALVLVHSAASGAGGGLSAAALASAVTDVNLYLAYLAVTACCAVIVLFAVRPQRGLP